MSQRYALLIKEWKEADTQAKAAERALNARFEAYLRGEGSEPTDEERKASHELRERERQKLNAAMEYVRNTTASSIR